MPTTEQEALFRKAHELNPWIAEPQVMLSQILFDKAEFSEAAHHAAGALQTLYDWGTCWDKRTSYAQWVGFARMAHLRASRRGAGLSKLPCTPLSESGRPQATEVTYLQDVIAGYEDLTEKSAVATEVDEPQQVSAHAVSGTSIMGRKRLASAKL